MKLVEGRRGKTRIILYNKLLENWCELFKKKRNSIITHIIKKTMSKDYFKNVTTFFTTKKTESKSSSDVPKKKEQVQAASDALDVARAIDNRPAREFKKNLIDAIKELNGRCKKRGGESFEMFFNIQFKRMTETIGKKIEEDFESETGLRLELDYETARVQWQGEDRTLRDIGWKILEYTLQDQGTDLLVVFENQSKSYFYQNVEKVYQHMD